MAYLCNRFDNLGQVSKNKPKSVDVVLPVEAFAELSMEHDHHYHDDEEEFHESPSSLHEGQFAGSHGVKDKVKFNNRKTQNEYQVFSYFCDITQYLYSFTG
jgi:hypothetical protein